MSEGEGRMGWMVSDNKGGRKGYLGKVSGKRGEGSECWWEREEVVRIWDMRNYVFGFKWIVIVLVGLEINLLLNIYVNYN